MNLAESQFDFLKDVDPLMHALLVSTENASRGRGIFLIVLKGK